MNRIRAVSKKRAAENRRRKKVTDAMKREGPVMCVYPVRDWGVEGPIDTDCNNRADDLHEIVSRARGGSITDPANLIGLCRTHHQWVTEHPIEAEKLGLSKRKEN